MRQFKENITLELSKELSLEVEGVYHPEEPMVWTLSNGDPGHPGSPSEFHIENIKLIKGSLCDLIDHLDTHQYLQISRARQDKSIFSETIWDYLTELSIKKIEE